MDYLKLPRLNFHGIITAIILGILVAFGLYQAQTRGLIPQANFSQLPKIQNQETRTVVQEENSVISAVDKTSASVVAIGINKKVVDPFDPFAPGTNQNSTIGTGFVVSDRGIIITNKHVVDDVSSVYTVVTKDGQKYDVKKIYRDPVLDLAIVRIDGGNLKPLELGDSSKIKVGQTAIAIGNALGRLTNTVTTGVVSGIGRTVVAGDPYSDSEESLDNLIQTDAAINPGNSGGPLLNSAGQVIAVNVATTEGAQNIGFAIPINTVKPIIDQFLAKGTVSRPFLGVSYRFVSKDLALLKEVAQGAYIQQVVAGSPADKASLREGDIITKINGQAMDAEGKLGDIISKSNVGDSVDLEVWRDGKIFHIQAKLGESTGQ